MKKRLFSYTVAILIIGISGCDSLFIRDTIGIPLKRPAITYQISLSTVTDGVPASFAVNLKRYLFAELSKKRLLGNLDEHPQMVHILVGYYKAGGSMGHAESMVNVMNGGRYAAGCGSRHLPSESTLCRGYCQSPCQRYCQIHC
ncbi:MAG: hypothetical protein HC887_12995 [Desulfobacteraceae bacterium]|nr:hypothetical protein [Desulfobacteraceae bacterium]